MDHPNIVRLVDSYDHDGTLYIVREDERMQTHNNYMSKYIRAAQATTLIKTLILHSCPHRVLSFFLTFIFNRTLNFHSPTHPCMPLHGLTAPLKVLELCRGGDILSFQGKRKPLPIFTEIQAAHIVRACRCFHECTQQMRTSPTSMHHALSHVHAIQTRKCACDVTNNVF